MHALSAIAPAIKDVFGGRLFLLALLCFALALAATIGAAWAGFRFLLPLIPEAEGVRGFFYDASEIVTGVGVVLLSIVLAPAVSMMVGGFLFDVAAERVEKAIGAPPGRAVPLHEALFNAARIAVPALLLNLISLPLLFIPGINAIWFLALNGYLMGREYPMAAGVRRMPWSKAKALRKRHGFSVFLVGVVCSLIPFLAPLVAASAMTRLVHARAS
jgi:CysZ protein